MRPGVPLRPGIKAAIDGVVFTDFPATKKKKKGSSAEIQGQNTVDRLLRQKGTIHKKFVPAGQTINAALYQAVLNRLLQPIRRVRPELHRTVKWMLLHDNAPAQSTIRVRQFLTQKMVAVLDDPTYSPDLAPADFLIPSLKSAIKSARFVDLNTSEDRVTAVLRSIPQEAFADCFRKLYERCQTCDVADGDYIEGQQRIFVSIFCFVCFLIGFTERFRHTVYSDLNANSGPQQRETSVYPLAPRTRPADEMK